MAIKPKKIETEVAPEVATEAAPEAVLEVAPKAAEPVVEHPEVVVTTVEEAEPAPVGAPFATTADEQLAGQIAIASAEDRLKAEIEAGKKAVAEAEARARLRTAE